MGSFTSYFWLFVGAGIGGALRHGANRDSRLFLTTGILGGFTTFSAFSLDAAVIWERGQTGLASTYVLVSLAGSLVGVFVGLWVGRVIFR